MREFIIMLIIGIACIVMGAITATGNLIFVKKRNKRYLSEENRLIFGRLCGLSTAIIGIGCIVTGVIFWTLGTETIASLAVLPFCAVSVAISVYTSLTYNKKP